METDKVNLLTQINTTKENVTQLEIEPGSQTGNLGTQVRFLYRRHR